MSLREKVTSTWNRFQQVLFPQVERAVGPLTDLHRKLIVVLDVICVEAFVPHFHGLPGRPEAERAALARAFVAKAVLNLPTTVALIDRLIADKTLRQLCGWERAASIPSASTFSRAFAEFAETNLPGRVHQALIEDVFENRLVGHIARDATAIEGWERPKPQEMLKSEGQTKRRRGRPRKGEEPPPKETPLIERQKDMSLRQAVDSLPKDCDVGCKRNAKGHQESWTGFKLHIDTADGDIPVSCILTSASLHDSQAAIPLAKMTKARGIINCYDLMDSAYDAPAIKDHSRSLDHVPIIDTNPRRNAALKEELAQEAKRLKRLGLTRPEDIRYNERSAAERVNSQIKESYGGENVRVRGHAKVFCHLGFGILAIAALQIMRLAT